jgi:dipeptidase D
MSTIKDLTPKIVWNNFYLLTRQPRPSKHEEKVRAFLLEWAKERDIEAFADEIGNVIMRAPATKGYENKRGVILQAHMDMVPQKTAETKHDFINDPIETYVDGDWLGAKGTTLGADNGIGVALAMSVLEEKDLPHGPVEVLFTTDEETGMTGSNHLEPGIFKGDILLNLDSEDEGELCIGCAGGLDGIADFKYKTLKVPAGYEAYRIEVKGLQGGHSGMDISLYRANACKIIARTLLPLLEKYGAKVADINAGSLRNAIPFEGRADVLIPSGQLDAAGKEVKKIFADVYEEFKDTDPGAKFYFSKMEKAPEQYIEDELMLRAVMSILACPAGVIRMSSAFKGLTETSTNLAMIRCEGGHLRIYSLMRSAVNSAKLQLAEDMRCVFALAGAEFTTEGGYSGWTPKPDTPVYKVICDVWEKVSGQKMTVGATHGGLECALLGAKYPHWEMASLGPTIIHPHSPDERVKISTVGNAWEFLKELLKAIPEK